MAKDRSEGRDVHFFDARHPNDALGGLILNPTVTHSEFLQMLDILITTSHRYDVSLRGSAGVSLTRCNEPLQPGDYDLKLESAEGTLSITDEVPVIRIISHTVTGRENAFRTAVRERDKKCVITGLTNSMKNIARNEWDRFEAAHVFPLASESLFFHDSLSSWITFRAPTESGIDSVQNGLLFRVDVHRLFDQYLISINPDNDYKIFCFSDDLEGWHGRQLDPICRDRNDIRSVRDNLLRWHFRQAVLSNMKGPGEPIFETDFPGGDMMGEIRNGPKAAERMEFELNSRLYGYYSPKESDGSPATSVEVS